MELEFEWDVAFPPQLRNPPPPEWSAGLPFVSRGKFLQLLPRCSPLVARAKSKSSPSDSRERGKFAGRCGPRLRAVDRRVVVADGTVVDDDGPAHDHDRRGRRRHEAALPHRAAIENDAHAV